ncbi:MAG: transposase [Ignavibacteriales bacterium]|nr:transposase [Ignavibacteriales bacterium]
MKKPWTFDDSNSLFFCTDVIVGWQYVFTSTEFFETIIDSLKYCQENKSLRLFGYVVMPNHVHSIVSAAQGNLASIIRDYKRHTSWRISELLGEARNRRLLKYFHTVARREDRGNEHKIWQSGSHPVLIESSHFFEQKLEYIHNNPVTKGYVERPEDWKFSSARNYALGDNSIIKVDFLE